MRAYYCSDDSSDDSSMDSATRKKKADLKRAAASWVAPTSTGVTNSEAIVEYDDLKTGKIYTEMEVPCYIPGPLVRNVSVCVNRDTILQHGILIYIYMPPPSHKSAL